jgi:hypothetical protein
VAIFACAGCAAALTAPVSRVALPEHAGQKYGHQLLGPLMRPGTYAINPDAFGPPWRPWAQVDPDEAEALGFYAPVYALSGGPRGAVVIAPGDVRGMVFIPERSGGYCCGLDGRDGPNMACGRCGRAVATCIDDCAYWQAVWLDPREIHRVADDAGPRPVTGWEALRAERPGVPPVEASGSWDPLWAAAVAAALARLLAVSGGAPVSVPDGVVAGAFRQALNALLPWGTLARTLALAGPGLPDTAADILLVPEHPHTGEHWPASGAVPVAWDVWVYLAYGDDPRPAGALRPDWGVFRSVLARLPEVRQPWLGALYDRVTTNPYAHPF